MRAGLCGFKHSKVFSFAEISAFKNVANWPNKIEHKSECRLCNFCHVWDNSWVLLELNGKTVITQLDAFAVDLYLDIVVNMVVSLGHLNKNCIICEAGER